VINNGVYEFYFASCMYIIFNELLGGLGLYCWTLPWDLDVS